MSVILVRTVLPNISGLAKDEVVNDFVFNAPTSTAAAVAAVTSFWTGDHTGGASAPVAGYLNSNVSRAVAALIQVYELDGHLDGSPHGSPSETDGLALTAAPEGGAILPDPLCGVMSYHAAYGTALETGPSSTTLPTDHRARVEGAPATHTGRTRPKSSLRGRLYIGPLASNAAGATGILAAGFTAALAGAGSYLTTAALGWCVWSRRNASVANIIGGWTDTEFGIQRRHNTEPRAKSPWPTLP